ncbi:MAG: heme-binding protein [Thermoplasmata archaeon]|nr:heme-binding protein [Thermoplasmata archaeon]
MTESVRYEVIKKVGNLEIREYPRIILATVQGLSDDQAFGILFKYITGNNKPGKNIDMTTPVISSEGEPVEIEMTAPVLSDKNSFSFIMPSKFTMKDIPEPLDNRINTQEIPGRRLAVLQFRGRTGDKSVSKRIEELSGLIEKAGIRTMGDVFLMRYNSPFAPGFMRRNEVAIEIDQQS